MTRETQQHGSADVAEFGFREKARDLVGTVLRNPSLLIDAIDVSREDLVGPQLGLIFEGLISCAASLGDPGPADVAAELERHGLLERAGGRVGIAKLFDRGDDALDVKAESRWIRIERRRLEVARLRRMTGDDRCMEIDLEVDRLIREIREIEGAISSRVAA